MTFNPFQTRAVRVTVNVSRPNASGEVAQSQYRFQDHRMRIKVRQGGNQFGNAHIEIYGAPLDAMNNIARLWLEALTPQNTDTVEIGVFDGEDFVPFFQGVITWSAVDASGMPQVKLVIEANAAFFLMNQKAPPYSNAGPVGLQDTLRTLLTPWGFSLDYSDAAPQDYLLTDVRTVGSPMEQIAGVMKAFPNLTWFVNLQRLVVRLAQAPYAQDQIRIAPDTGLMGYPVYSSSGLQFATLFNPQVRPGVALDMVTQFDFVNRTLWVAAVLSHDLDANVPGGQWTTSVAANAYGPKGNNQ